MKVNKKAAFSCSVPLDGEDVVVSASARGFCAFCRLLGNPLMPDLVIDRALGYVNLLLLLFFFLVPLLGFHCNFSPLFSPLLSSRDGMITSQNRGDYVIHHPLADSSEISDDCELGLRPNRSRHVFAFQSPPTFHQILQVVHALFQKYTFCPKTRFLVFVNF